MKKLLSSLAAAVLSLTISASAFAAAPTEISVENINGVHQYKKTFTLPPGDDPEKLVEPPFAHEGYTYTFSSMTQRENYADSSREFRQSVTVETEKGDLPSVLMQLSPTLDYDDGEYKVTLNLDHRTIRTEASGYETRGYTVKETRTITGLASNDMSFIPESTVKDGVTIKLTNVEWKVDGVCAVDGVVVPYGYTAVATYSGRKYYKAATGYTTTAEYVGTASSHELESITYVLTYIGEEIPVIEEPKEPDVPAEDPVETAEAQDATPYWKYILGGAGCLSLGVIMAILIGKARHTKK